ncbi:MAG: hypothetical protein JOZ52_02295 [Acidobacteria bacterium]|nr:hypothetical protein [Acidobacteriota bacterium]
MKLEMKKIVMLAFALVALTALPLIANAKVEDRLYDFTDAYYQQNGIDPTKIEGRRNGADNLSVFDTPFFSFQRNVRALLTLPTYDASGGQHFFTVMGGFNSSAFTNNRAGQRAQVIAETYIEYIFPTRDGNPIGLGNGRQSTILDMRNGYFSNDPLGLWLHVWVSYTDRAFNSRDGQKMLSQLARTNGLALDGTPIIKTLSELDNLLSKGFVQKRTVARDGSEGVVPYAICPVVKDPKDGGIALDQFLAITRKPDGTPVEPFFLNSFNSLKTTGDWPN